jgi:ABC-type antimicrobial peptide transport system permease subunit
MLNKLLWSKQKKRQIWLAMVGVILGFFLLVVALQTYFDLQNILQGKESNFVIVNKKVSLLNLIGGASSFQEKDLTDFENQDFIKKVAPFSSSQFQVLAEVPQIGFRSDFFFEAVPNDFLDVRSPQFHWSEGDRTIPIILSRDYLSLYNFGFAPTRGLPPFTQNTIKNVQFQIRVIGDNNLIDFYAGKIVGFSDRINSILVPKSFLDWSNEHYSDKAAPLTKLMLEVENPYSSDFKEFIKTERLELSSGKLIGDKVGNILNIVITVIAFIGLLILVLALMVFILNFKIMIASAKSDIKRLMEIGYQHQTVSAVLIQRMLLILTLSLIFAILSIIVLRYFSIQWLSVQGFEIAFGFHYWVYLAIITITVGMFLLNIFSIRRYVLKLGTK